MPNGGRFNGIVVQQKWCTRRFEKEEDAVQFCENLDAAGKSYEAFAEEIFYHKDVFDKLKAKK